MSQNAHSPLSAADTLPPFGDAHGWVCPRCRSTYGDSQGADGHCPDDGSILISARDYADAGGDALLGQTLAAGRFTVLARLGAGSMGTVYRARQEATGRDVALKILRHDRAFDAGAKARFEREARANSALASSHTVTVFDFGQAEDGSLFLAMEMLNGHSLGERLRGGGRLTAWEAVRITRDALSSLAEAHRKGIIHRDIKPDNLFLARVPAVDGSGFVVTTKVLDFGIAKVVREEGSVDALQTQAGMVFGTPRYMSPEQAQGKPLDARSDLYSLGVILYQMLVGVPPFEDEEAVVVMARHIKAPPIPPREAAPDAHIPEALERVVLRALAKSPDDRPTTAEEFAQELEQAMIGAPGPEAADGIGRYQPTSIPPTSPPAVTQLGGRGTWVVPVIVTVAAAALGVVVARHSSWGARAGAAARSQPVSVLTIAASARPTAPIAPSASALDLDDAAPAVPIEALPPVRENDGGAARRAGPAGRGGQAHKSLPGPLMTNNPYR